MNDCCYNVQLTICKQQHGKVERLSLVIEDQTHRGQSAELLLQEGRSAVKVRDISCLNKELSGTLSQVKTAKRGPFLSATVEESTKEQSWMQGKAY